MAPTPILLSFPISHVSYLIPLLLLAFRITSQNAISASISHWLIQMSSLQACQNDSHFEISSDCVVIGRQFHTAKSAAANEDKIGVNLKLNGSLKGVILAGLVLYHHSEPLTTEFHYHYQSTMALTDALPKMGAISLA